MNHADKAEKLFTEGYNCAQSVAAAFCDITGADEKTILRTSSPFGGGFGRSREVCGAISGACIVLGALYGYDDPSDPKLKSELYALTRKFMEAFRARHGAIVCRELLGGTAAAGGEPSARTSDFYKSRPCLRLVRSAAEILDSLIPEVIAAAAK